MRGSRVVAILQLQVVDTVKAWAKALTHVCTEPLSASIALFVSLQLSLLVVTKLTSITRVT